MIANHNIDDLGFVDSFGAVSKVKQAGRRQLFHKWNALS